MGMSWGLRYLVKCYPGKKFLDPCLSCTAIIFKIQYRNETAMDSWMKPFPGAYKTVGYTKKGGCNKVIVR